MDDLVEVLRDDDDEADARVATETRRAKGGVTTTTGDRNDRRESPTGRDGDAWLRVATTTGTDTWRESEMGLPLWASPPSR